MLLFSVLLEFAVGALGEDRAKHRHPRGAMVR